MREATTLAGFLAALAAGHGDREALVGPDVRLTYDDLERCSAMVAKELLARGVGKGSRVGIVMPNGPEWVVAWFAAARMGAVAVPVSTLLRPKELVKVLRHGDCVGVLAAPTPGVLDPLVALEGELPDGIGREAPILTAAAPHLRFALRLELAAGSPGVALSGRGGPAHLGPITDELLAAAEREVHADDPAAMIYTSGSTSDPKGVLHSHRGVLAQTFHLADHLGFSDGERSATTMPYFWVGGLVLSLLPTLAVGGMQASLARFDPAELLALIERERIERVFVNPARSVQRLLEHPDLATRELSSVRSGVPGFPPRFDLTQSGGTRTDGFAMGLGMSETLGPYWWGIPDELDAATPRLEVLSTGWELKVVDDEGKAVLDGAEGEVLVRGPNLAIALPKTDRAARFDADGYYRTGDIGLVDGAYVRFRGRRGDMIKASGANVAPAEVVATLVEVPGVLEAHVVGLPDPERGAVIGAAVVVRPGSDVTAATLAAVARRDLSSYKVPSVIWVVDDASALPLGGSGKVLQRELVQRLLEERRRGAGAHPTNELATTPKGTT